MAKGTAATVRAEAQGTATTQPEGPKFQNHPRFELWKPKKDGNGAGAVFEVAPHKSCIFLKMMPESGQENGPKFDNSRSIGVKLGRNDVGELLSVLVGLVEGLGKKNDKGFYSGLYHQHDAGNSTIGLSRSEYGYILTVSVKRGEIDARYHVGVTLGESCLLKVFLERYSSMFFESNQE